MRKIEKFKDYDDIEEYHSKLKDKINELVDAVNEMISHGAGEIQRCDIAELRAWVKKLQTQEPERNQCDGCRRGMPLKDGIHSAGTWDKIACTRKKYEREPDCKVDCKVDEKGIVRDELAGRLRKRDIDSREMDNPYPELADEARKYFREGGK